MDRGRVCSIHVHLLPFISSFSKNKSHFSMGANTSGKRRSLYEALSKSSLSLINFVSVIPFLEIFPEGIKEVEGEKSH